MSDMYWASEHCRSGSCFIHYLPYPCASCQAIQPRSIPSSPVPDPLLGHTAAMHRLATALERLVPLLEKLADAWIARHPEP